VGKGAKRRAYVFKFAKHKPHGLRFAHAGHSILFDFELRRVVDDDLKPSFVSLHATGDAHDCPGQRI
jgi:hypothetical protein